MPTVASEIKTSQGGAWFKYYQQFYHYLYVCYWLTHLECPIRFSFFSMETSLSPSFKFFSVIWCGFDLKGTKKKSHFLILMRSLGRLRNQAQLPQHLVVSKFPWFLCCFTGGSLMRHMLGNSICWNSEKQIFGNLKKLDSQQVSLARDQRHCSPVS